MFLKTSRYTKTKQVDVKITKKRTVKAVKLRRLPETKGAATIVNKDERLDIIAQRRYKKGDKFWHVADANTELEANDLVAESGRSISIPES